LDRREIGFAIIGCGMISNWHAEAVGKVEGARLVGAVDQIEEAAKTFSGKYNTRYYPSVYELLQDAEVDAVCICTPGGLHAPLAVEAADAGKHVVVEKPMALNLKECDEIITACERNKVKLTVISQLRFSEAVCMAKEAVEKGKLGRLVMGDIAMKYYRSQEYYDRGSWRGTWKMDGGGALMNQGIHGIDLLQYMMGPVKSVFAHAKTIIRNIEVEDTASAVVEFENGALGAIRGATSIYPGSPRRLEINGNRGTIVLEEDSILEWRIEGKEVPKDMVIGHTAAGAASNPSSIGIDGHTRQIADMVDAIKTNRRPLVDQYEGKKPVEIITAIYESSRTGMRIDLKQECV
jgi:predicted dehydrogenase